MSPDKLAKAMASGDLNKQVLSMTLVEKSRIEGLAEFYTKNMPAGGAIAPPPMPPPVRYTPQQLMKVYQILQQVPQPNNALNP